MNADIAKKQREIAEVTTQLKRVRRELEHDEVLLLEKETALYRLNRTLDFKRNQLDKGEKRLARKEGIFETLCIAIE